MRAPTSLDELVGWYRAGLVTGAEFLPLLLFLIDEETVSDILREVPEELVDRVLASARSLCDARAAGKRTLNFNFEGPVANESALVALCRWLASQQGG